MKKGSAPAKSLSKVRVLPFAASEAGRKSSRSISREELDDVFRTVGQRLREGVSTEAEELLSETILGYDHDPDDLANLKRLRSFSLETLGKYKDALELLWPYEDDENLRHLSPETQVRVTTQLAIGYNNLNDHPKAVTLLKANHERAKQENLLHLLGPIETGLARVYR
jgi:hypothetical protein